MRWWNLVAVGLIELHEVIPWRQARCPPFFVASAMELWRDLSGPDTSCWEALDTCTPRMKLSDCCPSADDAGAGTGTGAVAGADEISKSVLVLGGS